MLLGLFPALTISPVIFQPPLMRSTVLSSPTVVVAGLSFAAFLVGGCWACRLAGLSPLESKVIPIEDHQKRKRRFWPLFLLLWGALLAFVIMTTAHLQPSETSSGGPAHLIVTSVGGFVLWIVAFFVILAPVLRHRNPWPLTKPSRGAALVWVLVIILAAVMLALTTIE